MTTRIVIGDIGGGRSGMKCSLPGVEALTADDTNPALFSFCSDWSNLIRIGASGIVFIGAPGGNFFNSTYVAHGLGFVPFMEVRSREGSVSTVFNEKTVQDYHDLGGSGGFTTSATRIVGLADNVGCSVWVSPWSKIAFSGDTPFRQPLGPGSISFIWFAYREPQS